MRTLRNLCVAVVLLLALVAPASAGVISTGVAQQPPPAPQGVISTGVTSQTTAQGVISTGGADEQDAGGEATAPVSAAEIALTLLQGVLSLF